MCTKVNDLHVSNHSNTLTSNLPVYMQHEELAKKGVEAPTNRALRGGAKFQVLHGFIWEEGYGVKHLTHKPKSYTILYVMILNKRRMV